MSNTIGRFGYEIRKMTKTDDRPFNPIVILNLDNWSHDDNGVPHISNHLMHEGEIDGYIQALKDDLDAVGKRAKDALKRAKATTHKIVSDRNTD